MAYFECIIGGGGGGESDVNLIVTCSPNFAGKTITCTNGTDTFTQTCPSTSPYTVTFENIAKGTWTISGVISGQTFSQSVVIGDYTAQLNDVPEGSTVTPVNDIQIWLHCANIWDKTYTTLNEVLADNTTLLALISDSNAVDYMARSTSWASSVAANQTAMGYIGNNNYCANKLLSNSTWRTAICNSTYFESVLNVKVPTMTSNTTPSGEAIGGTEDGTPMRYKAFDNNTSTYNNLYGQLWCGYHFTQSVKVNKAKYQPFYSSSMARAHTIYVEASNDGTNWIELFSEEVTTAQEQQYSTNPKYYIIPNNQRYEYYRFRANPGTNYRSNGSRYEIMLIEAQFYGRA
jgi:hypothetical protein